MHLNHSNVKEKLFILFFSAKIKKTTLKFMDY